MCKNHYNIFDEHIRHVKNDISKPFTMGILQCAKHVCKMFEMDNYLATPSSNNEDHQDADWDTREK